MRDSSYPPYTSEDRINQKPPSPQRFTNNLSDQTIYIGIRVNVFDFIQGAFFSAVSASHHNPTYYTDTRIGIGSRSRSGTLTHILQALTKSSSGGASMRMRDALAWMRFAFSSGRKILTLKVRGDRAVHR